MSYPNFGGGGYPGAPGGGYPGAGGGYPGAGGGYPGAGGGYPGGGAGYPAPGGGGGYPGAGGGYPGAGGGYPGAGGGYPGAGGGYPGAGGAYPPGGGGGYPGSGGGFPITNPPVPYNGPIEGGVQDGKMVFISGFLTPEATNFYVNFRSGSDVAFHFNPRFHGGERPKVVRNAEIRGSWGNEETHGDSPFNRGSSFEIIVAIDSKCYKVSVNGNHYCEFNHRMTKEDVNTLEIGGDLTIQSIRYQGGPSIGGGGGFPGDTGDLCPGPPFPGGPGIGGQPGMGGGWGGAGGGGGFSVPHKEQIPHGGLYPGRMVFISGVPHSGAQGFQVNFTVGDWPDADKAFHFNPRFGENTVVRNTCQAGSWGGEERQQNNFPFQQGVNFDICIAVEHDKYKVAVNNQHFIEYRHRISDLGAITAVQIEGDIRLTNVRVQ